MVKSRPRVARRYGVRLVGANLVSQVLAHWTHVSDRAFRVLVRMALTALDKPTDKQPAAVYHGGRELLAMSLRSEKGSASTRYRAVKRAVAELTDAGAIRHLQAGWAGQNAVYRLTLDRARARDENQSGPEPMGGPTSPPEGGPTSPPMGGPSGTEWGAPEAPPRNQEELPDEREEEEVVDLSTTSHPPRATAGEDAEVISLTDRRKRIRDQAKADIAAKAAGVRARVAAMEAARQAEREAT